MTEFKGPIVEGAYYERGGEVHGPAIKESNGYWRLGPYLHHSNGRAGGSHGASITRRVYITYTDPAEVIAELRKLEDEANSHICDDDDYREDNAGEAYGQSADLVESMLGLARCGEGCDGNCELTAYGPTKAEAEVAELRSKAADLVAELRAEVADLSRHNQNEYTRDRSDALTRAADLVAEKLGVKP